MSIESNRPPSGPTPAGYLLKEPENRAGLGDPRHDDDKHNKHHQIAAFLHLFTSRLLQPYR
jgi:hypothetical protein